MIRARSRIVRMRMKIAVSRERHDEYAWRANPEETAGQIGSYSVGSSTLEPLTKPASAATFVVAFQARSEEETGHPVDDERRSLRRKHKRPGGLRR